MSDPFCPDCGGKGVITEGGVEQELGDDRDDGSIEIPCETCKNDEESVSYTHLTLPTKA